MSVSQKLIDGHPGTNEFPDHIQHDLAARPHRVHLALRPTEAWGRGDRKQPVQVIRRS
jgi:hypothetical protein